MHAWSLSHQTTQNDFLLRVRIRFVTLQMKIINICSLIIVIVKHLDVSLNVLVVIVRVLSGETSKYNKID